MQNLDDTQPVKPVMVMTGDEFEPRSGGPGCLVIGLVGLMVIGFAGLIIALAGFAGWSSGQRIAQSNATATTNAVISDQLNRITGDLNSKNQVLVKARLDYLLTLTPGVQGVMELAQTATAISLPTSTPMPTATEAATAQSTEAATSIPLAPSGSATPDLTALLSQAQSAVSTSDWDTAIDTLDAIMGYDGDFQTSAVRALMFEALTKKALTLYRGGDTSRLAEANQLTDRASQFGNIETSEANYESIIASLYLDAVNAIGVDYNLAIRKLTALYSQAPSYRDVFQKLVSQYIGYGDTLVAAGQPCSSVGQYESALALQNNASVAAKRDAAQTACTTQASQGSGTPLPDGVAPVGVAPIGVPPTPG
ncbi:MAG: hypothetical protein GC179_22080 [Anaerolineaceae bacterium]|nr:hypothetical protein [Anaerolineaceae bacterium]